LLPSSSHLLHLPHAIIIALMIEAARTSETLENFYQTTRCYNPKDSHQPLKMTVFWNVAPRSSVEVTDVSEVLAASIVMALMLA
jgi:hypothetical protein